MRQFCKSYLMIFLPVGNAKCISFIAALFVNVISFEKVFLCPPYIKKWISIYTSSLAVIFLVLKLAYYHTKMSYQMFFFLKVTLHIKFFHCRSSVFCDAEKQCKAEEHGKYRLLLCGRYLCVRELFLGFWSPQYLPCLSILSDDGGEIVLKVSGTQENCPLHKFNTTGKLSISVAK